MSTIADDSKFVTGTIASTHEIVILVPCFNEELTVGKTVASFREAMPSATVYVYDNNSTDRTVDVAKAVGAVVRYETRQGKGNVVRRMFADIDADVYVLVDGDATYEADAAPRMVRRAIEENLDFVNGARVSQSMEAYRRGHRFGNYVLTAMVRNIFGRQFTDMCNCSRPTFGCHAGMGSGLPSRVRRIASMARMQRRRAVSMTDRRSA